MIRNIAAGLIVGLMTLVPEKVLANDMPRLSFDMTLEQAALKIVESGWVGVINRDPDGTTDYYRKHGYSEAVSCSSDVKKPLCFFLYQNFSGDYLMLVTEDNL